MAEPIPNRVNKWVDPEGSQIIILPDGTLLDIEPVKKLIRADIEPDEETMAAYLKTIEMQEA